MGPNAQEGQAARARPRRVARPQQGQARERNPGVSSAPAGSSARTQPRSEFGPSMVKCAKARFWGWGPKT